MKKILSNKFFWIAAVVVLAVVTGLIFWLAGSATSPVEKATKRFTKAFKAYDIEEMKKMAVDPNAEVFDVLEKNEKLYKVCAENANIVIQKDDNHPIDVKGDKAIVVLKTTNFNTYAFKYNIKKANGNKKEIASAMQKVNTDRDAWPTIQLQKVDGDWKIAYDTSTMKEILGDMSFWGETKVTITDDVIKQLKKRLAEEKKEN